MPVGTAETQHCLRIGHTDHYFLYALISDSGFDPNPNVLPRPEESTLDTQGTHVSCSLWHLAAYEGGGGEDFCWAGVQGSPGHPVGPDWLAPGCPSLLLFCPLP